MHQIKLSGNDASIITDSSTTMDELIDLIKTVKIYPSLLSLKLKLYVNRSNMDEIIGLFNWLSEQTQLQSLEIAMSGYLKEPTGNGYLPDLWKWWRIDRLGEAITNVIARLNLLHNLSVDINPALLKLTPDQVAVINEAMPRKTRLSALSFNVSISQDAQPFNFDFPNKGQVSLILEGWEGEGLLPVYTQLEALQSLVNLIYLKLSSWEWKINPLNPQDPFYLYLIPLLERNFFQLQTLDLGDTFLPQPCIGEILSKINPAKLEYLNLRGFQDNYSCLHLFQFAIHLRHSSCALVLFDLFIPPKLMRDPSCRELFAALRSNRSVKTLTMSQILFSNPTVFDAFYRYLNGNEQIETLELNQAWKEPLEVAEYSQEFKMLCEWLKSPQCRIKRIEITQPYYPHQQEQLNEVKRLKSSLEIISHYPIQNETLAQETLDLTETGIHP